MRKVLFEKQTCWIKQRVFLKNAIPRLAAVVRRWFGGVYFYIRKAKLLDRTGVLLQGRVCGGSSAAVLWAILALLSTDLVPSTHWALG